LKTRIYSDGLIEEATYLLAEWLGSPAVMGSVAFPEIVVGVVVVLRRSLKAGNKTGVTGKGLGVVKGLVERIEESSKWAERNRKGVAFGPGHKAEVEDWEKTMRGRGEESPLGRYLKVLGKAREKRRALVEKVGSVVGVALNNY
jgi:nucleolar complex protein 2